MGQKDNDLTDKEDRINTLQSRNKSLSDMLQGQVTSSSVGGEMRRTGSGCSNSSAVSNTSEKPPTELEVLGKFWESETFEGNLGFGKFTANSWEILKKIVRHF